MPKPSEVLIWIDVHGSARELTDDEKKYVDTAYSPFDGEGRVHFRKVASPRRCLRSFPRIQ